MVINYQDISIFIDFVTEQAKANGLELTTLEELHDYLEDNYSKTIRFEVEED